ncbi:MAG: hypothetical protein JW814_09615, partial [Candidatus Krumholzibacteriota bacterium]|nr:hypothetical protein [Candidatus Krumholzibacteriota bacterium]
MSNIVSVYGASARCLSKLQILFLFLLLICSPSLVSAYWDPSGLIVCSESDDQLEAQIISDGNGGTIFVWQDERNGNWDIYAQRVDISGTILWANGGIPICTVPNDQLNPHIAYDGNGGALITWSDNRGATSDIYAQRINSSGVIQWAENGVAISTLTSSNEYDPKIAFDGIDGAIIVWTDSRNLMYDIFAQKVNFEGIIQWIENGIVVCSEENNQSQSNIIKDGLGGVIVSWDDSREGNYYHCIYTQRIDASGSLLWAINGVGVTNIGDNRSHYSHQICSDGAGGVIVTWKDLDYDPVIKAQRISSTGIRLWGEYAANSIVWHSNLDAPQIISDGKGG